MTKVEESVDTIKKMILDKQYDENGYLPSEGELSKQLSVSKATIREAIRTLEVRGFVQRMHGIGVRVTDRSLKAMTQSMIDMFEMDGLSLDDVLEVRWIIETKAVELAANRATPEQIDELVSLVECMEKSKNIDELYLNCDFQFHKKLVSCSQNKMLASITCAYSAWLNDLIKASSQTIENLEYMYHYHRNIVNAIKMHNGDLAKQCMKEHLAATLRNKDMAQNKR